MSPESNPHPAPSTANGESFFHELVRKAPLAIFVQTEGRFAYVNPSACAIFGAAVPEDLVGTPVLERFLPEDRVRIGERIRRLNELREAAETSQQEFLRLDGSRGFGETSAIPFVHEGRNGALVYLRDLTQHMIDQKEVRTRDELLNLTGRLAKVGGWEFDAQTLEGTWTEEVARIHDLDPARSTDVSIGLRFYTPESRSRIEAAIAAAITQGIPYDLELEMVTDAGNHKWVRTKGFPQMLGDRVVSVHGIFQDITESRLVLTRLAEEKERLAVTLRSIGDGVITTDTRGNVTMLNPIAEELTGWSSAEAQGRPLTEVFPIFNELSRERSEDPVAKVLRSGLVVELANHTCLISRDGVERSIADSGAPILDDMGRILGVVLVFRDVTEKHRIAESLRRTQSLESIGVLAGGIAHDFNNLLSGIFGNLCLAQDATHAGDGEAALRSLSRSLGIFERAKALTQQLLTFAKGGTPVRETIAITNLVQRSTLFALSGSNVSADIRLDPNPWTCSCDPNQISQVVDNLVLNARQSMPDGGVVRIEVENTLLEPGVGLSHSRTGPHVRIRVSDHGEGIPKDIQARIFDPFFSTKSTGHGLGLSTVHSIIQRHDGWIELESEVGVGTSFEVYLPARPEPSQPGTESEPSSGSWPRDRVRILVLDDEEFIAEYVQVVLESIGYDVVATSDGATAVDAYRKALDEGNPFGICFLDLTIPGGMGGVEAARRMKMVGGDAFYVASSGYSDDPVMAEPLQHGFHESLRKPFLTEDLLGLLRRILR